MVDTEGFPLRVIIDSAGIQYREGAAPIFDKIRPRINWLKLIWTDNGSALQVNDAFAANPALRVSIVKRSDPTQGYVALPRRCVVERNLVTAHPFGAVAAR